MQKPPNPGQYPYPRNNDALDSPALTWLRNHSDYLTASGFLGTIGAAAIYLRGFFGNLLIVTPVLMAIGIALGLMHRWILDNTLYIALCYAAIVGLFFAAHFGLASRYRLFGRSGRSWWRGINWPTESMPDHGWFERAWRNACQFFVSLIRCPEGAIVILGIAVLVMISSPRIIEYFWRSPAIEGFSLEQCLAVIVGLASIAGTAGRVLIGWGKYGTMVGISIIAAIGAAILWLITLRVATYIYYGTPPTGFRPYIPLGIWTIGSLAALFCFVFRGGSGVRCRLTVLGVISFGFGLSIWGAIALNKMSAASSEDLMPLTQSVSRLNGYLKGIPPMGKTVGIDENNEGAEENPARRAIGTLEGLSGKLGLRAAAGTIDEVSTLNPEDYSIAQQFMHTGESLGNLSIAEQQKLKNAIASKASSDLVRRHDIEGVPADWDEALRLTIAFGILTEKPFVLRHFLAWTVGSEPDDVQWGAARRLIKQYDRVNRQFDRQQSNRAAELDAENNSVEAPSKELDLLLVDILDAHLAVPDENEALSLLKKATEELQISGIASEDSKSLLDPSGPIPAAARQQFATLIQHSIPSEFAGLRETIISVNLRDRVNKELALLDQADVSGATAPSDVEQKKAIRRLTLLAMYARENVREIACEAIGELYDPSIYSWTDLPFATEDLQRQRQEDIYDWVPGEGIDDQVYRFALAARVTNRDPERANDLIRRMLVGPYGNFEQLDQASDSLFRQTMWGRLSLMTACGCLLVIFNFVFSSPNHTSIHSFYRDRLRAAFLVEPIDKAMHSSDPRQVQARERIQLSGVIGDHRKAYGPYPLICAALNLQGSSDESIRDRHADSFVFSPLYIGNDRLGFIKSHVMENYDVDLTADSAMAISAAAAAPNMGKYTVSWVSFLIVLLNVRLGRWIPHPDSLKKSQNGEETTLPVTLGSVIAQEWRTIERRRLNAFVPSRAPLDSSGAGDSEAIPVSQKHLFGLAMSGGGIRSASVSLGVTQTLDRVGLFKEIDYLSSVSGGGYTASAISTFMQTPAPTESYDLNETGSQSPTSRWNYRPPARYLLREMTGNIRESLPWIYVSDGGHFENTAAYELLKRRCELVVVSDGEEDASGKFPGLSNLMRLSEIDLNTRIDFPDGALENLVIRSPKDRPRHSQSNFAIGKIRYPSDGNEIEATGWLLYVRSSLLLNEDAIVQNLAKSDSTFPHQTTGDQSFDELQFEAYRRLGESMMLHTLEQVCGQSTDVGFDILRSNLKAKYCEQTK